VRISAKDILTFDGLWTEINCLGIWTIKGRFLTRSGADTFKMRFPFGNHPSGVRSLL
jgi:hypothetical protein